MITRKTDNQDKAFFRSERFYSINGQWFASCRGGMELGPFSSQEDAHMELMLYLRKLDQWNLEEENATSKILLTADIINLAG